MKLGLSSFTFGWAVGIPGHRPAAPLNEEGLLRRTRQAGLNLLQIGDNLPLHGFDSKRLADLGALAASEGVDLEVGTRSLTLKRISEYARIARLLNARLLRIVIDEGDYQPDHKVIVTLLQQAIPWLDGLTLGIENHDRFSAVALREILERVGNERIGICLDTANSLGAGEGIEAVARELAPFTVNLHIKDFHIERVPHLMGFAVTGRPAGAGMLNLPALLKQLSPYGRCQTAILELWTPPQPNLEASIALEKAWADQSVAYLRPFFDKG